MTSFGRSWSARIAFVAMTTLVVAMSTQASASPKVPGPFTAHGLSPSSTVTAPKSSSGRLARSDSSLLKRTDSKPVHVVVKLDYDPAASYRGGVRGYPATSPSVTGRQMTGRTSVEKTYNRYTRNLDKNFRAALAKTVPSARAGQSLRGRRTG
jgi:hypothetical protein